MANDHDERSPLLQNGRLEDGSDHDGRDNELVCKTKSSADFQRNGLEKEKVDLKVAGT